MPSCRAAFSVCAALCRSGRRSRVYNAAWPSRRRLEEDALSRSAGADEGRSIWTSSSMPARFGDVSTAGADHHRRARSRILAGRRCRGDQGLLCTHPAARASRRRTARRSRSRWATPYCGCAQSPVAWNRRSNARGAGREPGAIAGPAWCRPRPGPGPPVAPGPSGAKALGLRRRDGLAAVTAMAGHLARRASGLEMSASLVRRWGAACAGGIRVATLALRPARGLVSHWRGRAGAARRQWRCAAANPPGSRPFATRQQPASPAVEGLRRRFERTSLWLGGSLVRSHFRLPGRAEHAHDPLPGPP